MKTYTLEDLKNLARAIAEKIRPGDVLLLRGDLGAGKSTFSRFLLQKLCKDENLVVPSPTFNIIQEYEINEYHTCWHCDLYRLTCEEELEEIGILDAMGNKTLLIEWPERLGALKPEKCWELDFKIADQDHRYIDIKHNQIDINL